MPLGAGPPGDLRRQVGLLHRRRVKGWAQKRFFAGTGQVPIDRTGGRASEGALRAGLKVLQRGELFGIYPEGTRSHDGRLYKGRTGSGPAGAAGRRTGHPHRR